MLLIGFGNETLYSMFSFTMLLTNGMNFWYDIWFFQGNPRCLPNSNENRDTMRFKLKKWLHWALNPEPTAYNSSTLNCYTTNSCCKIV